MTQHTMSLAQKLINEAVSDTIITVMCSGPLIFHLNPQVLVLVSSISDIITVLWV